jgi:cell pole-organizing protein PopZ
VPESAPAPEPAYEPESAYEPEREPELASTEFEFEAEMVAEDPVMLEVVVSEPKPEPEADRGWEPAARRGWEPGASSWAAREESQPEPQYPAQRTNGGNHQTYAAASGGEVGPKSLEDSVKDMLRPMLQRWLDENMTRVLTAALKDELRDNPARFQGN